MLNGDPRDGLLYPALTLMIDSYITHSYPVYILGPSFTLGSTVAERSTSDLGVAGSRLIGGVLSLSRDFIRYFVLVQSRKVRHDITEKLLAGM